MRVTRLGWDGIEVTADSGESLVIDHVDDSSALLQRGWRGSAARPSDARALVALVTHLHEDHTDVAAIEKAVGESGTVLRPEPLDGTDAELVLTAPQEAALAASRLDVRVARPWEPHGIGPFTVTAAPAIDGLGDPQISWVVEVDGRRIIHGGDTMFHGWWWLIAGRLGPFDVAALPINGAVIRLPPRQPESDHPACMGPEDAVQAALLLRTDVLIPLHYGIVDPSGEYTEIEDPLGRATEEAARRGQRLVPLAPGDVFDVPSR